MSVIQGTIDAGNARFWDELCGSALARALGIEDASAESLRRFDDAYLALYPYLDALSRRARLTGRPVLEIGLGYGTLSGRLAARGAELHGLDIAPGPVEMVRHRLRLQDRPADERIVQGSALDMPFPDASFDRVYSIGCLHHTGDLPRAVAEVHRVLRPGGRAVVMLYNRHSFRLLVQRDPRAVRPAASRRLRHERRRRGRAAHRLRDATAGTRAVRRLRTRGDRRPQLRQPAVHPAAAAARQRRPRAGLDLYVVADR